MRGRKTSQTTMLTLVAPEQRVPKSHPLRRIKELAEAALQALSPTFDAMYAQSKCCHARRRRWLRHRRSRSRMPRARDHAARRADDRHAAALSHRRPGHTTRRLRREPADPQARRGDFRLDEDRRVLPEDEIQRPGPHAARRSPRCRRVPSAPDLEADARVVRPPHPASPPAARGERREPGRNGRRPRRPASPGS